MSAETIGYTEVRVTEGPELQAAMWVLLDSNSGPLKE